MKKRDRPIDYQGWGPIGLAEDCKTLRLAFSKLDAKQWVNYLDLRHRIPKESIAVTPRGRERILIALGSLVEGQIVEEMDDGNPQPNQRGELFQHKVWRVIDQTPRYKLRQKESRFK